jgi:3-hydroxyisobutyrate dehydrogenase-like beta-hydroxyacid dehydrogenase
VKLAKEAVRTLTPEQIYVDLNSVSPETKQQIGCEIEHGGGDSVEGGAIMAPVIFNGVGTPIP